MYFFSFFFTVSICVPILCYVPSLAGVDNGLNNPLSGRVILKFITEEFFSFYSTKIMKTVAYEENIEWL